MTVVRIFHNPRCSKSREALALLQAQGLTPEVVDYLKTPPSLAELQALLTLLDLPARELLRTGEDEYQALGLSDMGLSEQDLLGAIAAHPQLLQRPIVVHGERAVIARPPALALALLR
jgi:arsenate reductase (glutaredoxin)